MRAAAGQAKRIAVAVAAPAPALAPEPPAGPPPSSAPARYVLVRRDAAVQEARLQLPILAHEQVGGGLRVCVGMGDTY
jgi:hypothetical protein